MGPSAFCNTLLPTTETRDEYGRNQDLYRADARLCRPLTRYNQLLASNIEQLTRLQLASANAYAELGLNQLQAAGKVQDAQSLAALGTVQLETASQLSRQMLDDIQKLNTLGQQFKDDLDALAADGIKKSTGKA